MPPRSPRPCTSWPCNELRPCPIHDRPGVAERERDDRRVESRRIYNSARWKRLRGRLLRDQPWCPTPGCPNPTREVDHVLPIEDGGAPYDESNLQALCRICHSKKTADDVKRRRAGLAPRKPEPQRRATRRPRGEGA